jgi:hypothetical protein
MWCSHLATGMGLTEMARGYLIDSQPTPSEHNVLAEFMNGQLSKEIISLKRKQNQISYGL